MSLRLIPRNLLRGVSFSIYEGKSRTEVIRKSKAEKKYLEDGELLELSKRVLGKLEAMTDGKFAGMEFAAEE